MEWTDVKTQLLSRLAFERRSIWKIQPKTKPDVQLPVEARDINSLADIVGDADVIQSQALVIRERTLG